MTRHKFIAAVFGFLTGIVTAPLAILAWPIILAAFMFNETDEEEVL